MDIRECKKKGLIKRTSINASLIKSLIEISNIKEKVIKGVKLSETNISAYIPMAYDSLREVLEAFCVLHGYKVTSHLCLGELVRTLIENFDYFEFDRFRYIRNGINYYGQKVGLAEGKEIIRKMFMMKKEILRKINLKLKSR